MGHDVKLFDYTFYKEWTDLEIELNTKNKQFKKTNYLKKIKWNNNNILSDLKKLLKLLNLTSYLVLQSLLICMEKENTNFEYTYDLVEKID